ncbi:14778_t:CDS:1 [Cetraspora pellucida]|uniref:14778_t:CDS:1 n=1 Tax=Cetraspora pellucida TaxID=1433469 RepID=A0ACA9MZD8_9GLOM|nr:14778_t:CDS:1 [Cetraspora pellucida]
MLLTISIPSYAIKDGEVYIFNYPEEASYLGHLAWGFMTDDGVYTYGARDGKPSEMTDNSNGFWFRSGSFDDMINTFTYLQYKSYITTIILLPKIDDAIQKTKDLQPVPYDFSTTNCLDATYQIVCAYGADVLPISESANVWYGNIASHWGVSTIGL